MVALFNASNLQIWSTLVKLHNESTSGEGILIACEKSLPVDHSAVYPTGIAISYDVNASAHSGG